MIPKIIHYCWFGGKPLPELAVKCINSWRKYCPDYEIKEWNESNYDLNSCKYVGQAYKAKKWAFVSDYARFDILYKYGGLYFDTDVELIKPIDDIVAKGAFMGCEPSSIKDEISVAPGLGLAVAPKCKLYKEILDEYKYADFFKENKSGNYITVVNKVSEILKRHGLKKIDDIQFVDGIFIYPPQYFCPMDYENREFNITENTYSIHHYVSSWMPKEEIKTHINKMKYKKLYGNKGIIIAKLVNFPIRLSFHLKYKGVFGTIKFVIKKLQGWLLICLKK